MSSWPPLSCASLNHCYSQRGWLLAHKIIKSDAQKNREYYTKLMDSYYYSATDSVWHSWSDSQLRNWLIEQGVIKSDAQITRDKMLNLVS